MIRTVIRLKNDMVMVFDDSGEQLTAYQGQYDSVRAKIVQDAPLEAVFLCWFGSNSIPITVSKEEW